MWRRASRTLGRVSGSVGENRERLIDFIAVQDIELEFKETIAPALGMSSGGRIAVLPGQGAAEEFSTLVHELAHEMLHKAERRTATTKTVREAEAEAIAFVVGSSIGLDVGHALPDYIHLYHGNAALLAESLEVIQRTSALILSSIEPPAADAAPVMAEAIAATFPFPPERDGGSGLRPRSPNHARNLAQGGLSNAKQQRIPVPCHRHLHESTTNPRRTFEESKLQELADAPFDLEDPSLNPLRSLCHLPAPQRIQHFALRRRAGRPMPGRSCSQAKIAAHIDRELAARPELIQVENGWRNAREQRPGAVQRGHFREIDVAVENPDGGTRLSMCSGKAAIIV